MSAQHTPGPWRLCEGSFSDGCKIVDAGKSTPDIAWIACRFSDGDDCAETQEANARLIAAAPDLLAALEYQEEIERWIADTDEASPLFSETCRLKLNHAGDLRRDALAKAKGEQS